MSGKQPFGPAVLSETSRAQYYKGVNENWHKAQEKAMKAMEKIKQEKWDKMGKAFDSIRGAEQTGMEVLSSIADMLKPLKPIFDIIKVLGTHVSVGFMDAASKAIGDFAGYLTDPNLISSLQSVGDIIFSTLVPAFGGLWDTFVEMMESGAIEKIANALETLSDIIESVANVMKAFSVGGKAWRLMGNAAAGQGTPGGVQDLLTGDMTDVYNGPFPSSSGTRSSTIIVQGNLVSGDQSISAFSKILSRAGRY
jgi:hypothetical protein